MNVHMDAAEWIKSIVHEEACMDSTSSLSGEIISCNRQPQAMERRLRPQHEQPLKCPRCDSTHTKFCYYNNYSLSQPRYFCKTCRRYWTKGGSLRNVPVGGGCRKNKRSGGKKPAMEVPQMAAPPMPLNTLPTFPSLHLSHLNSLPGASHGLSLMDCMMENQTAAGQQSSAGHFFASGFGEVNHGLFSTPSYHGGSAAGFSAEGGHGGAFIEPYQSSKAHEKLLCLEWQQEQLGFPSGLSFWAGMMNGHGSSASNPLV